MQVNDSSVQYGKQSSIYPYYKPDNIFERDQAYYEQLQRNTRRGQTSLSNTQNSQRMPYQQVETQYNNYPPNYLPQQNQYGYQSGNNQVHSTVVNVPIQSSRQSHYDMAYGEPSFGQNNEPISPQFSKVENSMYRTNPNVQGSYQGADQINEHNPAYNLGAMIMNNAEMNSLVNQANYRTQAEENRRLKQRLDDMINFRDFSDDGTEVKKKYHYNKESSQGRTIIGQESQIQALLEQVKKNNTDIGRYRNAIVELQKSINNIQSVDREIYKQLKNLSNRDQELLDRATSALARGATREQVAGILQRIIS